MIFLVSVEGRVLINGEEVESIYTKPSWNYCALNVILQTKKGEIYCMGSDLDEVRAKALIKFYHDRLEGKE